MKVRKFLSFAIAITVLMSSTSISAFALNNNQQFDRDNAIEFLQSQGFPEDFLSQRVDQDLIELVNEFKQGNVTLCSIESSVIDESGNTYSIDSSAIEESGNMPMGTIPNYKMHLTTAVTAIKNSNNSIKRYDVYAFYDWQDGYPQFYNGGDGMTINWDYSVLSYSSFSHTDFTNNGTEMSYTTTPSLLNQGGIGYTVNVAEASGSGRTKLSLTPANSPMYEATINSPSYRTTAINANYSHKTGLFSSVSFSYVGFGVGMDVSNTDDAATASTIYYKY